MDEQAILLKIVQTWNISSTPEYRGFRCAYCQRYRNQSWYHWLRSGKFIVPLHLCNEKCHTKFEQGELEFKTNLNYRRNVLSYSYSEKAKEAFDEIISKWDKEAKPQLKAFICDSCSKDLDIDTTDGYRKGYHVWYEMKNGDYAELHFHKRCFDLLGQKI